MDIWRAILLGIVQGLTEFLPVSSSGHLVLAERLFGVDPPGVTFEVMLHTGTLLAVLVYFRKRLLGIVRDLGGGWAGMDGLRGWKYIVWIAVGTLPAVVIGLLLKDHIESAFSDPRAAAGFLIVTGILLFATLPNYGGKRPLGWGRALGVGCAQAAALLPGISRSGSTISAAMILGISPAIAAEFSFLLSIPAILGASALSLGEAFAEGVSTATLAAYGAGGLAAGIVGYVSIWLLFGMIKKGRFWWFGAYCVAVGTAWLIFIP